jgi:predicted glycogen debranching enzyme
MASTLPAERLNGEWLEADGLGGFASGAVSGIRTRRYHALLLAATTPPTGRMVLVNGLETWLETPGGRFALSAQRYMPDVVHPDGAGRIVEFQTEPWPSWIFRAEDGTEVSQEVVACHERGHVIVRWQLRSLPGEVQLMVRPLLSGRDYHALHHENQGFDFNAEVTGARVLWRPYPGVPAISAVIDGSYRHEPAWYRNFQYCATYRHVIAQE